MSHRKVITKVQASSALWSMNYENRCCLNNLKLYKTPVMLWWSLSTTLENAKCNIIDGNFWTEAQLLQDRVQFSLASSKGSYSPHCVKQQEAQWWITPIHMVHDSSEPLKLDFILLFYHIYYRICSSADSSANAIIIHLYLLLPVLLRLLIRPFPNGVWQCTFF